MDIPIPMWAYTGKPTPFGGSSLEYFVETHPSIDYERAKGSRLSTSNFPLMVKFMLFNISNKLPDKFFVRGKPSLTNTERLVANLGLEKLEEMVDRYPRIREKEEISIMTVPFSVLVNRDRRSFKTNLGVSTDGLRPTVSFCDPDEVARVCALATSLLLPFQVIAKMCLVVGLSQSMDPTWVRLDWKKDFINEVKRFEAKLREWDK